MSILNNLSGTVLRQAANIRDKIQALEAELVKVLNSTTVSVSVSATGPSKKTLSPAGKAKIIAAQKARWAKVHAAKADGKKPAVAAKVPPAKKAVIAKPAKKKGGLSAAGKAKIIAAQKARWAKIKAAKKVETK
jgi:hypothetical protein